MRIAVFGAGGVGGYFGGRLAEAGEDVAFVARGDHLEALRSVGLRVESPAGDLHLPDVEATAVSEEIGPAELVLVGTKTWQVPEAARAMRPLVDERTAVLPLQNGVEAPEQLAAVLGPERVLGGLCRILSYVAEPGLIRHAGVDPVVVFGEWDGQETPRCRAIQGAFDGANGVRAERSGDVRAEMWKKLLIMASVGGVGSAVRAPFGVIRSVPEVRRLVEMCMEEVVRVAGALGVAISADHAEAALAFLDGLPPEGSTSMQRDLAAGRRSELEAQLGVVVRRAEETAVDAPVSRFLYGVLLPTELGSLGELPG